ncbi:hypothetical protein NDU88_007554 [Pleurodeles waltl]|uniref:Uncharacterized protein n=1 Tax=Pleurodeles waltl TaxID=8319 RepID=A0AAV7QNE5_PLEWA|nr:hypothetical protein NDU88_007554 [Pleurodeles waltl]
MLGHTLSGDWVQSPHLHSTIRRAALLPLPGPACLSVPPEAWPGQARGTQEDQGGSRRCDGRTPLQGSGEQDRRTGEDGGEGGRAKRERGQARGPGVQGAEERRRCRRQDSGPGGGCRVETPPPTDPVHSAPHTSAPPQNYSAHSVRPVEQPGLVRGPDTNPGTSAAPVPRTWTAHIAVLNYPPHRLLPTQHLTQHPPRTPQCPLLTSTPLCTLSTHPRHSTTSKEQTRRSGVPMAFKRRFRQCLQAVPTPRTPTGHRMRQEKVVRGSASRSSARLGSAVVAASLCCFWVTVLLPGHASVARRPRVFHIPCIMRS